MSKSKKVKKAYLKKALNNEETCKYDVSIGRLRFWYHVLNDVIFDGKLTNINFVIKNKITEGDWYAYFCYPYNGTPEGDDVLYFCFSSKMPSLRVFINVLSHEMIHHHQYLNKLPVGHGPSFKCWSDKFKSLGLDLKKRY